VPAAARADGSLAAVSVSPRRVKAREALEVGDDEVPALDHLLRRARVPALIGVDQREAAQPGEEKREQGRRDQDSRPRHGAKIADGPTTNYGDERARARSAGA
jgi:hypothetical protein